MSGKKEPTEAGAIQLDEEDLDRARGGTGRRASDPDENEQTENVTINFAKVKYVYTPQK